MPISRREFLFYAGVATTASCVAPVLLAEPPKPKRASATPLVALEQSGSWSTDDLVYGVLAVANPTVHLAAFRELRKQHKYRRALLHRRLDATKLPYGRAVVDYFLRHDDFFFAAVVLKRRGPTSRSKAIATLTATIREHGGPQVYEQDVRKMKKWAKKVAIDDLRQLADVLTGAVYVDLTGNTNQLKSAFAAQLRDKLKVKNLQPASLAGGKRFVVI